MNYLNCLIVKMFCNAGWANECSIKTVDYQTCTQ